MSIRKHIDFNGHKNIGFVDYGIHFKQDEPLPVANNALVFMIVSMESKWKIPIAYFFITSLTSSEKRSVVEFVVQKVSETGAKILTITCDGLATNISMAHEFGLDKKEIRTC